MAGKRTAAPDQRAVTELARQLGALLAELGLTEIEVDLGGARVRLARAPAPPAVAVARLLGQLAALVALANRGALVMELLTPCEPQLDLGPPVLEV